MYEGWVLAARLPETISAEDKATMPGIKFKDEYEEQEPVEDDSGSTDSQG